MNQAHTAGNYSESSSPTGDPHGTRGNETKIFFFPGPPGNIAHRYSSFSSSRERSFPPFREIFRPKKKRKKKKENESTEERDGGTKSIHLTLLKKRSDHSRLRRSYRNLNFVIAF